MIKTNKILNKVLVLVICCLSSIQLFSQEDVQMERLIIRLTDKNNELEDIIKLQNAKIMNFQKDSLKAANEIKGLNEQLDKKTIKEKDNKIISLNKQIKLLQEQRKTDSLTLEKVEALKSQIEHFKEDSIALSEQYKKLNEDFLEKEKELEVAKGGNAKIINILSDIDTQYNNLIIQPFSKLNSDTLNRFTERINALSEIIAEPELNVKKKNLQLLSGQFALLQNAMLILEQQYNKDSCEKIITQFNSIDKSFDILSDTLNSIKKKINDYPGLWKMYQAALGNLIGIDKYYKDVNKDGDFDTLQYGEIEKSINVYSTDHDLRSIPYISRMLYKILKEKNPQEGNARKPIDEIIKNE
jgi:hypothetical protein